MNSGREIVVTEVTPGLFVELGYHATQCGLFSVCIFTRRTHVGDITIDKSESANAQEDKKHDKGLRSDR